MDIKITISNGKRLSVEVLNDSDENAQDRIDAFLEEHFTHKLVEHGAVKSSIPQSHRKEHGEWHVYPAHTEIIMGENYQILECETCGVTQDVTNGDFIFAGVNISLGEDPLTAIVKFVREDLKDEFPSKLNVIKSVRRVSGQYPQLFEALNLELTSGNNYYDRMLGLGEAKLFAEQNVALW